MKWIYDGWTPWEPEETKAKEADEEQVAAKRMPNKDKKRRRPAGFPPPPPPQAPRRAPPPSSDREATGSDREVRSPECSPEVQRCPATSSNNKPYPGYVIPEGFGSGKPCIRKAQPPKEPPAKRHLFADYVFDGKPSQSDYGPNFTIHNIKDNRFYPTRGSYFMTEEAVKAWTCRPTRLSGPYDSWVCTGCSTKQEPDKRICGPCSTPGKLFCKNDWICPVASCKNHNFEDLTGLSL